VCFVNDQPHIRGFCCGNHRYECEDWLYLMQFGHALCVKELQGSRRRRSFRRKTVLRWISGYIIFGNLIFEHLYVETTKVTVGQFKKFNIANYIISA